MFKRIVTLCVIFMLILVSTSFAEPVVKIGTGKENGIYNSVAGKILQQQLGRTKSELITSNGSIQNLERLKNGEIDVAFCQFDSLIATTGANMDLVVIKRLYPEYVTLIVKQGGKKSIKDFDLKNTKFAIGPDGSGTWVTWKGLCATDKSYTAVATVPVGGSRALSSLESGDVDGVLLVGGLGIGDVMKANADGSKFELCAVDDWDFDNAIYKKEKIYQFTKIPSKIYPGLIECMLGCSTETIMVDAVLVTTSKWADENDSLYEKVFDAATKTIPNIKLEIGKRAGK